MLIRLAYDIQFDIPAPVAVVAMLNVHPSRAHDLLEPDELQTEPRLRNTYYLDGFGNRCTRFVAPQGQLRLFNSTLVRDSGRPDETDWSAREIAVGDLPHEMLSFLLNSRYCEVDRFSAVALDLFGHIDPGGDACRRSATGCTTRWCSTTARLGPQRPLSMYSRSGWACAVTSSIWPSPSAER